jgi:hypothetical protein
VKEREEVTLINSCLFSLAKALLIKDKLIIIVVNAKEKSFFITSKIENQNNKSVF